MKEYTRVYSSFRDGDWIYKDRPIQCYNSNGQWVTHPTLTSKGRLLHIKDNLYRAEEKTSEDDQWQFIAAGTAEWLELTEQEIKWAIDKR